MILVTAGTPPEPVVKEAASLPAVSWMALASSPEVGVGVGVCYGAAFRGRWRSGGSRRAPVWSIRRRVRLSCRPVPSPKGVKPQPER